MRVLLVEDDELLGDGLKAGLQQHKYTVDWVKDGIEAEQACQYDNFDVMVLDLGLPKRTGLQVLQKIRADGKVFPVIILTAREGTDDKVLGLDSGADDYMVKPCDIDELAARIRALHRRKTGNTTPLLTVGKLVLDPSTHEVSYDNEPVVLPRREFVLLQSLIENAGKIVTRENLVQALYGWSDVDSNTLEVHIHHIRKKLPDDFIRTIRGVGYMITKPKESENTKDNHETDATLDVSKSTSEKTNKS